MWLAIPMPLWFCISWMGVHRQGVKSRAKSRKGTKWCPFGLLYYASLWERPWAYRDDSNPDLSPKVLNCFFWRRIRGIACLDTTPRLLCPLNLFWEPDPPQGLSHSVAGSRSWAWLSTLPYLTVNKQPRCTDNPWDYKTNLIPFYGWSY